MSYFLCDSAGVDLYHQTDLPEEDVPAYLDGLIARIDAGELEGHDAYVIDSNGERRAVDYSRLANGWYSIVTTPYSLILGDLTNVYVVFVAWERSSLAALVAMAVRDWRRTKAMEHTNETVRVLGQLYYAIYLVNYKAGTYEMIKGSDYVRERIPERGPYEALLRTASEVIEEATFQEFEESFSAENIRSLVAGPRARLRRRLPAQVRRALPLGQRARALRRVARAPRRSCCASGEVDAEKQRQLRERHYLDQALDTAQEQPGGQAGLLQQHEPRHAHAAQRDHRPHRAGAPRPGRRREDRRLPGGALTSPAASSSRW